jgi:indole-3-glycerol phosphate synthase
MKPDLANILHEIVDHKLQEISLRKRRCPEKQLHQQIAEIEPARPFVARLRTAISEGHPAVIAELKKAAPNRGLLRRNYEPAEIARSYEANGAACISVATDSRYFNGEDEHLTTVHQASSLPVLRNDYILDAYQIFETRAIEADCITLIVSCLDDHQLRDFCALASQLGLDVLVEIHTREELERAMLLRTPMIGINNRDLHTFDTNLDTTLNLLTDVLHDRIVVTESGIHKPEDVALMRRNEVSAFLVGEVFMNAAEPGAKLKELFGLAPE